MLLFQSFQSILGDISERLGFATGQEPTADPVENDQVTVMNADALESAAPDELPDGVIEYDEEARRAEVTPEFAEKLEGFAEHLEDIARDTPGAEDPNIVIDCDPGDATTRQPDEILEFSEEEAVERIQGYLLSRRYDDVGDANGQPDGMFGDKSGNALAEELRRFQEEAGLPQTGEYDDKTAEALTAKLKELEEGGHNHEMLKGFIEGLEALDNKDIEGESALDRLYDPDKYQPDQDGTCTVTWDHLPEPVIH